MERRTQVGLVAIVLGLASAGVGGYKSMNILYPESLPPEDKVQVILDGGYPSTNPIQVDIDFENLKLYGSLFAVGLALTAGGAIVAGATTKGPPERRGKKERHLPRNQRINYKPFTPTTRYDLRR